MASSCTTKDTEDVKFIAMVTFVDFRCRHAFIWSLS